MNVLACEGRFVVGMYRRDMKVIGYLGALDRLFGVPLTTRNWNTLTAIAKVLRLYFEPCSAVRAPLSMFGML